jgi:nicotinamide-nucleotide amidase
MFTDSVMDLAKTLLRQASEAKLALAFAESCTGGLIAAAMTELDGASVVVERGFVVYSNRAKIELLGVPSGLIERHGAVSEEVARAMAEGALKHSGAQLAVSTTGIAGPTGGTPAKPIGLVHFAAARGGRTTLHLECRFGDIGRGEIRIRSVEAALKLLLKMI